MDRRAGAKGDTGAEGEKEDLGGPGPKGDQGPPGNSLIIGAPIYTVSIAACGPVGALTTASACTVNAVCEERPTDNHDTSAISCPADWSNVIVAPIRRPFAATWVVRRT